MAGAVRTIDDHRFSGIVGVAVSILTMGGLNHTGRGGGSRKIQTLISADLPEP